MSEKDEIIETMEVKEEEKEEKNSSKETMSKSKAKREARKAEVKAAKRKNTWGKILETAIGVIIAALFIGAIVMGIYQTATTISPDGNYSANLTEDGFIAGEDLSTVKDLGFESMVISKDDVAYLDDEVRADIDSMCTSYKYTDSDASYEVKDGDTIDLDYTGSVDGVEFEGGSATGASLTIGSGSFIDDFEQQLIGSHPGDAVTVEVTFPDPYDSNPDLAGKDAVFECVVNGISVVPEFDDAFVAEHLSDEASTADEYRAILKERGETQRLEEYITNYVSENAEVSKYPKAYLKSAAALQYYSDQQTYEYYNSYYQYSLGYSLYESFDDFTGMSSSEYQKDLKSRAKTSCATTMTYEAIYKNNNLQYTDEQYAQAVTAYGDEETVGKPFLEQCAMKLAAMEYIKSVVTVQ